MNVTARLKNSLKKNEIVVATNSDTKVVSIASKATGYGSSVNGAELLLLSIATCYCNDIYREAAKRGIGVSEVSVEVTGEFGKEGEPGRNFIYKPTVVCDADKDQLDELLEATDRVAEIHNTLRQGLDVMLMKS